MFFAVGIADGAMFQGATMKVLREGKGRSFLKLLLVLLVVAFSCEWEERSLCYAATGNASQLVTQGQYVKQFAAKMPQSKLLPANAAALSEQELFTAVAANLQKRGIILESPQGSNTPLTRNAFVDLTYSFMTAQPSATMIERKYFLKDKGVVNPEDIGIFTSYEGLVHATRFTTKESVEVSSAEPVFFKDTIETDEESRVVLRFDDMSVLTLGEESIVEINQMLYDPHEKSRETVIKLVRGKLRVKAAKIASSRTNFEIQTPTAVIGVRGTEFIVDVDRRGHTRVVTLEGLVAMKPLPRVGSRRTGRSERSATEQEAATEGEGEGGGEGAESQAGQPEAPPQAGQPEVETQGEGEILVGANSGGSVGGDGVVAQLELSQGDIEAAVQSTTLINPVVVNNDDVLVGSNQVDSVLEQDLDVLTTGGPDEGEAPDVESDGPTDEPTDELVDEPTDDPPVVVVPEPPAEQPPEVIDPGDLDSDGDTYSNNNDAFPDDSTEWVDSDGDGVGDNGDAFPDDSTEWADSDGDGVGDNSDAYPDNPNLSDDENVIDVEVPIPAEVEAAIALIEGGDVSGDQIYPGVETTYTQAAANVLALQNANWVSFFGPGVNRLAERPRCVSGYG